MKTNPFFSIKSIVRMAGWSLLIGAGLAYANWVYSAYIVNQIVSGNQNFTLNLNTVPNASGMNHVAAQAIYSSATVRTNTFNDGTPSTGTITVKSVSGLSAVAATEQITIAATAVITSSAASDSLTVVSTNGLTNAFITLNGNQLANNGWRVDKATDTAADIATQINLYVNAVIANANGTNVVSLVARKRGAAGNSFSLTTSTGNLSVASANFTGGIDNPLRNQSIIINGVSYLNAYYWNQPNNGPVTSSGTATSIARLMNMLSGMQANAIGSVVYATATVAGTASNLFTVVSTTPSLITVANPTFTGGKDNAVITINGIALTQGNQWTATTIATTAQSISNAIQANSSLSAIIASTSSAGGIVYATSTVTGANTQYAWTSSTPSAITVSNSSLFGGANSAYQANSGTILIPSHGLSTGFGVVYSTNSGVSISPLVAGTTYYAISVDANNIELATSQANAFAGTFITLTTQLNNGPHTFTLSPQPYTGTASMAWYASNDCVNWNPVNVSSLTITSPTTSPAATLWDFGRINYTCLQLQVIGPTQGGLNLAVKVNGKN